MLERHLEQLFSDTALAPALDAPNKHTHTAPKGQAKLNALRLKGIAMACLAACALWLSAVVPPQSTTAPANAAAQDATRPSTSSGWHPLASSGWHSEPAEPTSTPKRPTPTDAAPATGVPMPTQTARLTAVAKAIPTLTSTPPSSPTPSSSPSASATTRETATATGIGTATPPSTLTPSEVSPTIPTNQHVTPVAPNATPFLAPATDSIPTRLAIPAINLEAPIIKTGLVDYQIDGQTATTWAVPDHFTVGWHDTSALPGQGGNTVLNGHRNIYGAVFQHLDQLISGDEILVYVGAVAYRYRVAEKHLVVDEGQPPEVRAQNVRWILSTPDERLTLVTCAPAPHGDHRLIVVARPMP